MDTKILEKLNLTDFVCFDVETTGLNPDYDSVIEFSAVRFEDGEIEEKLTFLCDPEKNIPSDIEMLTGISNQMIKGKKSFQDRMDEVMDFIGTSPLVAHNISFDIRFLKNGLKGSGRSSRIENTLYDTMLLSQAFYFYLSNHKLGTLADYLDLNTENSHRAEADSINTGKIFLDLIEEVLLYDHETIQTINFILKKTHDPNNELYRNVGKLLSFNKELQKNSSPKIDWAPPQNILKAEDKEDQETTLDLEDIFGKDGKLAQEFEGYEERPQQKEFAEVVHRTIENDEISMIEAGTGVGKSLGYIIPTVLWNSKREEKKRIVITSNTKNLQEQIFDKEIPFVKNKLGLDFTAVLLKGRKNYICKTRWNNLLDNVEERVQVNNRSNLIPVLIWLKHTQTGDIFENNGFSVKHNWKIWSKICSEPGYCTTKVCSQYGGCFLGKARRMAKKASVLVVNHSLLLANAAANNKVLPPFSVLVIDEAHNLEQNGYSYFADEVRQPSLFYTLGKFTRGQKNQGLLNNIRKIAQKLNKGDKIESDIQNITSQIKSVKDISRNFFSELISDKRSELRSSNNSYSLKKRYQDFSEDFPETRDGETLLTEINRLVELINGIMDRLADFIDGNSSLYNKLEKDIDNALADLKEFVMALDSAIASESDEKIYWYEIGNDGKPNSVKLASTPLNIGGYIRDKIFDEVDSAILTSATLKINDSFEYIANRIGLNNERKVIQKSVGSPFIYQEQMKFITYCPQKEYTSASDTARLISQLSRETKKGIMMLFTSYRALKKVYKILNKKLRQDDIQLMAQGISGSRSTIVKKFRKHKHSVLLGTSSFWEGVDLIGDALEILLIDKLPFPVPSDPIIEANAEEIQKDGQNPFLEYTIPETVLKFRQGVGRLIRSTYDMGVLINMDNRVVTKRYGRYFQNDIPVENETMRSENQIITEVKNFLR